MKQYKQRKKHIKKLQARARIEAIEFIARSHPECAMNSTMWNPDSALLNMRNGTLNLETGILQLHSKSDCITNMLDYDYDASADYSLFRKFLHEIFAEDEPVIKFIQKLMGYSLLGYPVEAKMFFFTGNGANGKTTLVEIVIRLMGSYAYAAQYSTFVKRHSERIRNDIAALVGKRFVSAPEIGEGDVLDESMLKQITGMDTINARFLHRETFNFKPQFVLCFTANRLPQVSGVDGGIWRRILVVPFEIQIPEEKQDKKLFSKLCEELSGILNFALEGLQLYREEGLSLPKAVSDATSQYRKDSDKLAVFIQEVYVPDVSGAVPCAILHKAYADWCITHGVVSMTRQSIRRGMEQLGYGSVRRQGTDHYKGLKQSFL